MTGMQHSVDKGIFFSFLDSRYGAVDRRVAILEAMRAGGADVFRDAGTLNGFGGPNAPGLGGATQADANGRLGHLYRHWFGYVATGSTSAADDKAAANAPPNNRSWSWQLRPPPGVGGGGPWPTKTTTGWWGRWNGNAFDIFRTTLVRAVEVSLGLTVGDPVPRDAEGRPTPLRHWPIDFLWICGAPKFEGWVSWRCDDDLNANPASNAGRVQVLVVTPSIGDDPDPGTGYNSGISLSLTGGVGPVHGAPFRDYDLVDPPADGIARDTSRRTHGLWVIGHEFSQVEVVPGTFPSQQDPNDDWLVEANERQGGVVVSGFPHRIVTVQPAELDGGVRTDGRTWQ
jgi:hypothetical protein